MVKVFYTTIISVDHAHHDIFHAKVGKGGIIPSNQLLFTKKYKSLHKTFIYGKKKGSLRIFTCNVLIYFSNCCLATDETHVAKKSLLCTF